MTPMNHLAVLASLILLTACAQPQTSEQQANAQEAERTSGAVNVIDAVNLNELVLTVSNPEDAVVYFRNSLKPGSD